jgi:folate-binding protein YgfZ
MAREGDAILIDAAKDRLPDLLKRLSLYKLRAKVELSDQSASYDVFALYGETVEKLFGLSGEGNTKIDEAVYYIDPRYHSAGVRVIAKKENNSETLEKIKSLGFSETSLEDYDYFIAAWGLPNGLQDLPVERAILLENGFDELHGIDWDKGCYLGQELTARTRYRGLVRKRLLPVVIEGVLPSANSIINVMIDGKNIEAGEMRSIHTSKDEKPNIGLALIRLEIMEKAKAQNAPLLAGDAILKPYLPAWYKAPEQDKGMVAQA